MTFAPGGADAPTSPLRTQYAVERCATEWSYTSRQQYDDPFSAVELAAAITGPDGSEQVVPAYWAGDHTWRIRFAPPRAGSYQVRSICSDQDNADLHDRASELRATPYTGSNGLLAHGSLRVSSSGRYLEHADGTPFFWLADTWWMGFSRRLRWPADLRALAADRAAKGFSVIQIVAGLYPDMPAFDERGANEAGFPWDKGYQRINPAYFDMVDLRIQELVDWGLVPCIVGCWGYFVRWMGVARMRQHWRNLVARYSAYPVVWCLAGEATMPYYLAQDRAGDSVAQRADWTELTRYVRQIDPGRHPVTIHPPGASMQSPSARTQLDDPSLVDIDLLQTGHEDRASLPATVLTVVGAVATEPPVPVVNSEVCYEGILEASRADVQRLMFWACVLSGAAGHTYGANGLWQINTRDQPYGPSPHGFSWGDTPWQEAYQLPGSAHVALGKRLLERYPWFRFEPHPEWVEPHWTRESYELPYAAGIPGELRVLYFPTATGLGWLRHGFQMAGLEPDAQYHLTFWDPTSARQYEGGVLRGDGAGRAPLPNPPVMQDWVLVCQQSRVAA